MEDVTGILLEYGLAGVVIIGLAWGLRQERADRIAADLRERETLKEAITTLERSTATDEKLVNAVASLADEIRRSGGK